MRIISFSAGSVVALFPLEAFVPLTGPNERGLLEDIDKRYHFGVKPNLSISRDELEKTGLIFDNGTYQTSSGVITIARFSVHNDGIVVRAPKTDDAESFFSDVKEWLINECGFRSVNEKRLYLSEIVVEFEKRLDNALKDFETISKIVTDAIDPIRGVVSSSFYGFSLQFETNSGNTPRFSMERRIGSEVERECYYCSAPLTTQKHLKVLEELEAFL